MSHRNMTATEIIMGREGCSEESIQLVVVPSESDTLLDIVFRAIMRICIEAKIRKEYPR